MQSSTGTISTFEEAFATHQHKRSRAGPAGQRRTMIVEGHSRADGAGIRRSSDGARLIELEHCMEIWYNGPTKERVHDRRAEAEKWSQLCEPTVDDQATLGTGDAPQTGSTQPTLKRKRNYDENATSKKPKQDKMTAEELHKPVVQDFAPKPAQDPTGTQSETQKLQDILVTADLENNQAPCDVDQYMLKADALSPAVSDGEKAPENMREQ